MRKLIFISIMTLMASTSVAQLRVISTGQTQTGTCSVTSTGGLTTVTGSSTSIDSIAPLRIIGPDACESGGRIAFGNRRDVSVAESTVMTSGKVNTKGGLVLTGAGGLVYSDGSKAIVSYDPSTLTLGAGGASLSVSVPVSAPQYLTVSDSRSKTDIETLDNIGLLLGEIVPVSYHLIIDGTSENSENSPMRTNGSNNNNSSTSNPQFGFLAQDVREVYPELVYEDTEGNLSIDYIGFIPILVDAVQHLQAKVEEQAAQIEELKNPAPLVNNEENPPVVASLSQNRPNPFRVSTEITCVIPEMAANAFLCVYDLNGNQKLRCDIMERGETQVIIEGNRLNAGMYIYTLIIDGYEIDSKRMILTD